VRCCFRKSSGRFAKLAAIICAFFSFDARL
jgi:hypothetical protein